MIGQQQQSIRKRKKSRNKHCKIFITMLKKFVNLEDDDNDRILQIFHLVIDSVKIDKRHNVP
ncbi:hypothetical protein DERP_008833 [Dermatophagoides pteronyssinus]|uniref:Uncharacterized protein n=1 Tax=Dermatophagoides pteronyssinus TaxID=6956 RepID=A0ABQ8IWE3_DERPT|nr:hypothetical protein DERP_008833 [Dermatophagoides pteronyssinus]